LRHGGRTARTSEMERVLNLRPPKDGNTGEARGAIFKKKKEINRGEKRGGHDLADRTEKEPPWWANRSAPK